MLRVQTNVEKLEMANPKHTVGYGCRKGTKPNPNQDDFSVLLSDRVVLLSVFDGHGMDGHYCAYTAQQLLPQFILTNQHLKQNVGTTLEESFKRTDETLHLLAEREGRFSVAASGTTCTTILIKEGEMYTAHVGDSRAILVQSSVESPDAVYVHVLTHNHSPEEPTERLRIETQEGEVRTEGHDPHPRIYCKSTDFPGLAMSRALGDEFAKIYGVIAVPDISHRTILPQDLFVVLCSDGVWDVMSESTVANIIHSHTRQNIQAAVDHVIDRARQLWRPAPIDDITCLVYYLH